MRYNSGSSFRQALEIRIRTMSIENGISVVRLRKMVAFDRFLARILISEPDRWILKGGLALQLRMTNQARTTKDIDLRYSLGNPDIYSVLQKAVSLNLNDWFTFEIADRNNKLDEKFGGKRYPVHSLLDGRTFEDFHIDIGIGDPVVEDPEKFTFPPFLDFTDLPRVIVPCYPITQQIAEKVHAYTRPRPTDEPSRVKDIVDILLLANLGILSGDKLRQSIQSTFDFEQTHPIPKGMPRPPQSWSPVFARLTKEVGLAYGTINQGFNLVQQFLEPILLSESTCEIWEPSQWRWMLL